MPDWPSFWLGWLVGCALLNFVRAYEHQRAIREHNRQVRDDRQAGGAVQRRTP